MRRSDWPDLLPGRLAHLVELLEKITWVTAMRREFITVVVGQRRRGRTTRYTTDGRLWPYLERTGLINDVRIVRLAYRVSQTWRWHRADARRSGARPNALESAA